MSFDIMSILQTVIGVAIGSAIAPFVFYWITKKIIVKDILKLINTELAKPSNQILLSQIKEKVLKGILDIDLGEKPPELRLEAKKSGKS